MIVKPEGDTTEVDPKEAVAGAVPVYKCRMGGCGLYYHLDCVKGHELTNTVGMKNKTCVCIAACGVRALVVRCMWVASRCLYWCNQP
jgi:hypothetical protein